MQKILDILKKMGASKELQDGLMESLETWKQAQLDGMEQAFKKKLDRAKQVCLEETERYKGELSKRVEIFLEARVNTINREAQKQAAIGESEAAKTLRGVKGLLEGVDIDMPDNQIAEENKKLRIKVGQLQEERSGQVKKNQHANQICRKLIERVKVLESKAPAAEVVSESKKKGRLEDLRSKGAKPKTTRRAITESVAKPAPKQEGEQQSGHPDVMAIAEGLDGSPASVIVE
jgi:uncharacterized protein (TIGR02449 family)